MRSIKALSASVALLIGLSVTANSAPAAVAHYRYDHGYALNNRKVSPGTTFKVGVAAICRSGYAESVRHVTEKQRVRVYAEYGIAKHPTGRYEIDHVIPLELGGNNAIRNLWPEPNDHPRGYLNSKDKLENKLHSLVCAHRVALVTAQKAIANDWVAAYHRFLGTWPKKTAAAPSTTTTATSTTTKVPTTTLGQLLSPSGKPYRAGQFCPTKDVGITTRGSNGPIRCELVDNYYRWVNV